jgi:hypothetical protein
VGGCALVLRQAAAPMRKAFQIKPASAIGLPLNLECDCKIVVKLDCIQAPRAKIHHDRLLVHWKNGAQRVRFNARGDENRRRARCLLKNGNWNIQDIFLAQSLLHDSGMGFIAKQAQRSMLIIPDTLYVMLSQKHLILSSVWAITRTPLEISRFQRCPLTEINMIPRRNSEL